MNSSVYLPLFTGAVSQWQWFNKNRGESFHRNRFNNWITGSSA